MGSGGGSGRYTGPSSPTIETRIQQAKEKEQQRLDFDVNAFMADILGKFNGRDRELTAERLGQIETVLSDRVQMDRILLGGSVAKHTEVDGISDVDALVVLDRPDLRGATAAVVRQALFDALNDSLPRGEVADITVGTLAVTVTYRDGMEIQLLPAVKSGRTIAIPSGHGGSWNETSPAAFHRELSQANERLRYGLVPAIKLLKAIVARFPEQKRLSGYHLEALAVDAAKRYTGAATPRALLLHLLDHASTRVREPLPDKTGQSRNVDAYLGGANSLARRNVALTFDGMKRRLNAATTVSEWKAVFED